MEEAFTTDSKSGAVLNVVRGLMGAALGGVAGFYLFGWVVRHGLYPGIAPGALVGLGCGLLVQRRNILLAVSCGPAALAVGLFTEWNYMPFVADGSFSFFLHHLSSLHWLMQGLGGLAGFWFALGTGSRRYAKPPA